MHCNILLAPWTSLQENALMVSRCGRADKERGQNAMPYLAPHSTVRRTVLVAGVSRCLEHVFLQRPPDAVALPFCRRVHLFRLSLQAHFQIHTAATGVIGLMSRQRTARYRYSGGAHAAACCGHYQRIFVSPGMTNIV